MTFKVKFTFANNCRTLLLTKNGCKHRRKTPFGNNRLSKKKKKKICIFIFVSALITVKQNYRTCDQVLAELENKWSNFSIWGLSEAKNVRSEARISDFFWSMRSIKNPRFAWSRTLALLDQKPSLRLIKNPRFAWSKTLAALNRKP